MKLPFHGNGKSLHFVLLKMDGGREEFEAFLRELKFYIQELAGEIKKSSDASIHHYFNEIFQMHLSVIRGFLANLEDIVCREKLIAILLSRLFLDNLSLISVLTGPRFYCQLEDNSCFDVEVLPSEIFQSGNLPIKFRSELFYKGLKVGDILDCKVRDSQANCYNLIVMNKTVRARVLYDCVIIVLLPKNEMEISLLKGDLVMNEYVRVAVSNIVIAKQLVTVTLDENFLQCSKKYIQLGRITESNLSSYVRDSNNAKSHVDLASYLKSSPKFKKPITYITILMDFGLDPKKIYSFYPFSFSSTDEPSGQELLKSAKSRDLDNFLALAESELSSLNYPEALTALEEALKLDPKCVKAYEIRARLNANIGVTKISGKAIKDIEMVLQLDTKEVSEENGKYLAQALLKAAVQYCKKANFETAAKIAKKALLYDKDSEKIQDFLNRFKKAHPECFVEDVPLNGLEQKKQEIVTQLNQISMSGETST